MQKGKTRPIEIKVRLTPKASRTALGEWTADATGKPYLKAYVTAAPDKGKANAALIELLNREWGIARSRIALIRGETDRNKLLRVEDATEDEIKRIGV